MVLIMDIDTSVNNSSLVEEFRLINNNNVEISKKCNTIAQDIKEGSFTIVELVEQLKVFLVDTSPENREFGMLVLSRVLELLPKNLFVATQLNFICAFYADRLNDHHQVIPAALKGILALMKFENVPEGATKQILDSLFQNVPCQQQQQADRFNIYNILEICLDKRYTELQQMGFDFIYGVISAMDGERDPRNLLYLFKLLPSFLKRFNLGHLTEEMFEVMACYFPVDFRAPSQDPNTISRNSLASALTACLCAVPQFSEYCLPLALEKLSSTLRIAKLDSLDLLAEGCKTFELSSYIQHSTDIWSQLQREALNTNDSEIEAKSLRVLVMVITKLSFSSDEVFKRILSDISDTLKGNLSPDMKLFVPSFKILLAVAEASKVSSNYITFNIAPILINIYNITATITQKVIIFQTLINFVVVYVKIQENHDLTNISELRVIPNLCLDVILHEDDEMKASGLNSLSRIVRSLPFELRECFYRHLRTFLILRQEKSVRDSLLNCFQTFATIYSLEVRDFVLRDFEVQKNSLHLYLEALGVIVDQAEFTESVLSIFVCFCLDDFETAEIALDSLKILLEVQKENDAVQRYLVENKDLPTKLIDWTVKNISNIEVERNKRLLDNISLICKLIVGYQPSDKQKTIIDANLKRVLVLYGKSKNEVLIIILDGLLTHLRRDVLVEDDFFEDLLEVAFNSKNYLNELVTTLLANLLNKTSEGENLEVKLRKIKTRFDESLKNQSDQKNETNGINLIAWTTKALVMRGYVKADTFILTLLELLDQSQNANVARSLQIIMNDDCPSLSNESYCNKRLLYRQKFFLEVSTKLIENYRKENPNYLLAIGYLLQAAPRQVFIMQFNKILRLVILCLEQCEDAEVLCAVLDTIYELIKNKESLMEEHIQEFLPRFLKLATFEASMQVRVKALQCLAYYTEGFPLYKLLPHKQDVIYSLSKCLDDKKRLVRKEAVQARHHWFMLDAPT